MEKEIAHLEPLQKSQFQIDTTKQLASLKPEYETFPNAKCEFLYLQTRQSNYENADRPSRLLELKQSECLASIDAIKDSNALHPPKLIRC